MKSKKTFFLNVAFMSGVLYPVMLLAEGSRPSFCLKTCTEEHCATSQKNYQRCQDLCRGKYDGLIKSCKKSAQAAGFIDEKINNEAKFHPCPPSIKEDLSGSGKGLEEEQGVTAPASHANKADASDEEGADSEKTETSQDGNEDETHQESSPEEEAEAPSDDDGKSAEEEEA